MKLRKIVAAILGTTRAHNRGRRKFAGQLAGTAAAGAALGASAAQALPGTTLDDADPYRVPADQLPIVLSTDAGARGWCRLVSHPGLRVTVNGRPFAATFVDTAAKLAEGYDITGRELAELVDDGGYPPGLVRALYRDKTVGVFRGSGKVEGNPFRLYADESFHQIEAGEADPVAGPYKLGEWLELEFNTPGGEVRSAGDCWTEEQTRREIRHAAVRVYVDGQPAAQWFEGMPAGERRYWLEQQPAAVDCEPQHAREGRAKHEDATIVPSRFDANGRLLFDDDDQADTVEAFREANHRDFEAIDNQLDAWANDVRGLGTALESLQNKGKA
jgi:hypothetical protein